MRLLLAFLFTLEAFAGAGTFPQGDSVKLLRDKLKFKTGRTIESNDVDPQAVATPADQGSILTNDNGVFFKTDDGTTTNWVKLQEELPDQTGHQFEGLFTNGLAFAWNNPNTYANRTKDNLMSCGSFDNCVLDTVVVTTDAFANNSGKGSRTEEKAYDNTGKYNLEGLNIPTSTPYDIKGIWSFAGDFDGKQMVARCEIKTARTDVKFIVGNDLGVSGEIEVSDADTWTYYEIPFVGGAVGQYFEVNGETTADINPIEIDNCFIGKDANQIKQFDIAMTDFVDYTPSIGGIGTGTVNNVEGSWSRVGDKMILQVAFNMATNGTGTGNVFFTLPTGYAIDTTKLRYDGGNLSTVGSTYTNAGSTLNAVISIEALPNNIYFLVSGSGAIAGHRFSAQATVPIVGWSVDTSSIVTQRSAIDPEKAGFTYFAAGDFGESDTFKYANGQCLKKTDYPDYMRHVGTTWGECTIDVANDGFNVPDLETDNRFIRASNGSLAVGTTQTDLLGTHNHINPLPATTDSRYRPWGYHGSSVTAYATFAGGTGYRGYTSSTGGSETRPNAAVMKAYVRVKDASNTIVGKFENINSTDLQVIKAVNNSGQAMNSSSTPIPFTEVEDLQGIWDGDEIVPNRNTTFLIVGMVYIASPQSDLQVRVYNDLGTFVKGCGYAEGAARVVLYSCHIDAEVGRRYSVRINKVINLSVSAQFHHLYVQELPDYEAIVKNLSNQKTKCQIKHLSANVSTVGEMTDIRFENIDTSKRYLINAMFRLADSTTTVNDKYGLVSVFDGDGALLKYHGITYARALNISRHQQTLIFNKIVKPTENSIRFHAISMTNVVFTSGVESTQVQVCELPDTYVETTEF